MGGGSLHGCVCRPLTLCFFHIGKAIRRNGIAGMVGSMVDRGRRVDFSNRYIAEPYSYYMAGS